MLNPADKKWSAEVLKKFGIDEKLFAPLTKSASVIGEYKGIKVVAVAGHRDGCSLCHSHSIGRGCGAGVAEDP